jgi:hypothetical protein
METKLLYVNKGSAYVRNNDTGDFISEVQSTICKAGDLVSIEGVAISTKGTGADTIEIPSVLKNYRYKTNELKVEFMTYIHDNFQYAVRLPVKTGNIYVNQNFVNYGDSTPDPIRVGNNNDYSPKNENWVNTYAGYRYYIGSFNYDGNDIRFPIPTVANDQYNSLGKLGFQFLTTEVPIKVDVGYNTPENITSKVTQDLHSSMFVPNRVNSETIPLNYYQPNYINTTAFTNDLQATCVSENSSVITIDGVPKNYFSTPTEWYSLYQNFIAVQNPFYWYWGSRLKSYPSVGVGKQNGYMNATYPTNNLTQADIVTINELRGTGTRTFFNEGDVIATNLMYNTITIYRVQQFIHSLKIYNDRTGKTREEMKQDKSNFTSRFLFGMFDDSDNDPYANVAALPDKMGTGVNSVCNYWTQMKTFYNENLLRVASLPVSQPGIEIVDETFTLDDGTVLQDNEEVCKYYDINIVRIRATGNDVDTIGFISTEVPVMLGSTINNPVVPGSFCLFDSSFTREESQALLVATTDLKAGGNKHTLADIVRGFNIGAPNINLTFNGDRSRFGWSNMYWSNYIGNELNSTTSVPDADVEVISCNRLNTGLYRPTNSEVVYTQFAQSGLSFWNFYVRDGQNNWILIDKDNDKDIKEKFTNGNFLSRLGFDFYDIFDSYGVSIAFYQERSSFNNNQIEFPQIFPYPLTNNPEVDTAFNISINANDASLPTFNLSLERNVLGINVAVQSSEILARNKPEKLATPFWLIESDIIPGVKYNVDGNTRNILGVVNRAYGSGDFVFSFASDYKFIVTKGFVVSHIKTNILTSDLLPALVDDNTTIIYKIESPILPNFVSEEEAREIEEEMLEKKKE